jgi:glutamyl-Q tRNA(Asp) synthetase
MDDIDPLREVPGAATAMLAALPAFGLVADEPVLFQSQRIAAYDVAFKQLRDAGHLFPCWCSRGELASAGGMHRDGHCIAASVPDRAPAWRLRVPDVVVSFNDALQGPQRENLRDSVGDFVIRRAEGFYSYQLACVVDDAFQQITEVVRGSDLLESTARQIWLQRCLDLPTPAYRHLPLVQDADGRKLSKSAQAFPLDAGDPVPTVRRALAFLKVAVPAQAATAEALLAQALANFDPAFLPHCSGHSAD